MHTPLCCVKSINTYMLSALFILTRGGFRGGRAGRAPPPPPPPLKFAKHILCNVN